MLQRPLFLCLAHGCKGLILLEEARRLGARTLLIAKESTRGLWPDGAADEVFYFPDFADRDGLCKAVAYLARTRRFDALFSLDELTVEVAAVVREHLGLQGLDISQAHRYRDKLLMRQAAARADIPQPRFVAAMNDAAVAAFVAVVPAPWYLKPRCLAGSAGIFRVESAQQLSARIGELGEQRGAYLLEESIEGRVYHVDSLVNGDEIPFAQVHLYGDPPWQISHHGGVFTTATVHAHDPARSILTGLNARVVTALGPFRGVVHAEFLELGGHFYFLEAAARVGGANIDVLVEKSCGLNLSREWLRMELCSLSASFYRIPPLKSQYGAMLTCLARQPWPDLEELEAPELVWKLHRFHHLGLILTSSNFSRLHSRLNEFKLRMERDFLAVMPPHSFATPAGRVHQGRPARRRILPMTYTATVGHDRTL